MELSRPHCPMVGAGKREPAWAVAPVGGGCPASTILAGLASIIFAGAPLKSSGKDITIKRARERSVLLGSKRAATPETA